MVDLPQMPPRIAKLPRDHRGFPVPWFVQWMEHGAPAREGEGEPDFRVIDSAKFARCIAVPRCWICGEMLGKHRVFLIGPMCAINRVISEPPSHRACAEFAVKACPFMVQPRMRRNGKDIPVETVNAAGLHIDRNPGVTCLWETHRYKPFRVDAARGEPGILYRLGDPTRADWWAEGRAATREEVMSAIGRGLPQLVELAELDGRAAVNELKRYLDRAMQLLPPEEIAA